MKDFWSPVQKIIEEICVNFDSKWQIRKRVIDTHFLVLFIFKLVLSKNQQGYKSLLTELWEREELNNYQHSPVSSSSLCKARQKLPEEVFIELNQAILLDREKAMPLQTWRGHRVFAADGSKFIYRVSCYCQIIKHQIEISITLNHQLPPGQDHQNLLNNINV